MHMRRAQLTITITSEANQSQRQTHGRSTNQQNRRKDWCCFRFRHLSPLSIKGLSTSLERTPNPPFPTHTSRGRQ